MITMLSSTFLIKARLIILLHIILGYTGLTANDRTIKVSRMGNCPGATNLTIILNDFRIAQLNKTTYRINGEFELLENITDRAYFGKISILRCQDMNNIDRCTVFIEDLKDRDLCEALDQGFLSKSNFMLAIKPRVKCPFYAGKYNIRDGIADGGFIPSTVVGSNINFILMRITQSYHKRQVMCMDIWIQLVAKRKGKAKQKENLDEIIL